MEGTNHLGPSPEQRGRQVGIPFWHLILFENRFTSAKKASMIVELVDEVSLVG
jgi:hypothetical protein